MSSVFKNTRSPTAVLRFEIFLKLQELNEVVLLGRSFFFTLCYKSERMTTSTFILICLKAVCLQMSLLLDTVTQKRNTPALPATHTQYATLTNEAFYRISYSLEAKL